MASSPRLFRRGGRAVYSRCKSALSRYIRLLMKLPIVTGDEAFPASRKVHVLDGELQVPQREIALAGGEAPMRVYDTSGPQGHDPTLGLPKMRTPWIERRVARGDRNFSQMHYARRGDVTEEMRFCAIREGV